MSDRLAQILREVLSLNVVVQVRPDLHSDLYQTDISICNLSPSQIGVRMALWHPLSNRHFWADNKTVEMKGAPPSDHPDLFGLLNQLAEAVCDELFLKANKSLDCPDILCRQAIRNMFSMQADAVVQADMLFARAYDLAPRGLYLAWRAQTKTIMKIERLVPSEEAVMEEAEALCAKALEEEPHNSMVLATVANTHCMVFRDFEKSQYLARRSVEKNATNPMAWFALSSAQIHMGNTQAGLKYTLQANRLAASSPHRFWWDSQVFAATLSLGNLKDAEFFAQQCHIQNPIFRPALRYLIAMHAEAGREEEVMKLVKKLTALEPDFSLERMVKDSDYPVALLRQEGAAINLDKLSTLA